MAARMTSLSFLEWQTLGRPGVPPWKVPCESFPPLCNLAFDTNSKASNGSTSTGLSGLQNGAQFAGLRISLRSCLNGTKFSECLSAVERRTPYRDRTNRRNITIQSIFTEVYGTNGFYRCVAGMSLDHSVLFNFGVLRRLSAPST
jgi:hypothetical protein